MTTSDRNDDCCAWALERFDPFLRDDLVAAEQVRLARHLGDCPTCACRLDDLARLKQALRSALPADGAPPELRARIRARLAAEAADSRPWTWRPLAAAAALMFTAAIGWVALRQGPAGDAPEATARRAGAPVAQLLELGLRHEIYCAEAMPEPREPQTLEALSAKLGSEYGNLPPALVARLSGSLRIVDAHACRASGREFAHVVLRDGEARASVLVSDLAGLEFRSVEDREVLSMAGVEVHRLRRGNFDVSAFSVGNRIVYVVSGASSIDSFELAAVVHPATSDALLGGA